MGAAWRALLRPLLLLLFIVGVLVVLLGHPGAQRMRAFPICPLPHFCDYSCRLASFSGETEAQSQRLAWGPQAEVGKDINIPPVSSSAPLPIRLTW